MTPPAPRGGARMGSVASSGASFPVPLAAVAAVLLFGFFLLLGFPYQLLVQRLAGRLDQTIGGRVVLGSVGPGLGIRGPHLTARDVRITWSDGVVLDFERLRLRPAWSFSWLRLSPALHVGLEGGPGRVEATIWPDSDGALEGTVLQMDLAALPIRAWRPGLDLGGFLDGQFAFERTRPTPTGALSFLARDGLLGLPSPPISIPYAELTGQLRVEESGALEIEVFDLEGPMLGLSLQGSIGPGVPFEQAPLRLTGQLRVPDPNVRQAIAIPGLRFAPDGSAPLRIAGTVSAPAVR